MGAMAGVVGPAFGPGGLVVCEIACVAVAAGLACLQVHFGAPPFRAVAAVVHITAVALLPIAVVALVSVGAG